MTKVIDYVDTVFLPSLQVKVVTIAGYCYQNQEISNLWSENLFVGRGGGRAG